MRKIICFMMMFIIIPTFITSTFFKYEIKKIVTGFNENNISNTNITVRILNKDNSISELNLEDYLIGVVAGEVPVYFEEEAIKAQAVAARTYALKTKENNKDKEYDLTTTVSTQVYKTDDELKNQWKENYSDNISKIKKAVEETKGEYVSYNNDPIYAFFFSTSNGYTENNVNVFGQNLPYLKSVDSSFDLSENTNSLVTKTISLIDFYNFLNLEYKKDLNVSNVNKSETGRILSLVVNSVQFNGRDFQKKLGLRSNDIELKQEGENVVITTKGFGHGVGMSQYGANALAKQKKTYKDILKYYYSGTSLEKL